MGKDCELTKEQCEMLDIDFETDPDVQKDKIVSMYRDFDPEDIIITKNETGLEEIQFF